VISAALVHSTMTMQTGSFISFMNIKKEHKKLLVLYLNCTSFCSL